MPKRLLVIGMSFPFSRLKFIGKTGIQNKVIVISLQY